jgi:hypothetical protein
MKKIRFKAILTNLDVNFNPIPKIETLGFHLTTMLTKEEMNTIQSAFMEKKQLQITIKNG